MLSVRAVAGAAECAGRGAVRELPGGASQAGGGQHDCSSGYYNCEEMSCVDCRDCGDADRR